MAAKQVQLTDILLKNIESEIPLIILKEKKHVFESFVRGYHEYMDVWDPKIGDKDVHLAPEEDNEHDSFAVAIFFQGRIVGHVPRNLSRVMNCFMKIPGCSIACKVTGKRVNRGAGYGLEIPVSYELIGAEKAVDWAEKKLEKYLKL